ncbi:MAG: hypothetical protein LBF89_01590 [Bacteroidales bacterium]|nr:hypothetical protein [Bacteroidales bacterium]
MIKNSVAQRISSSMFLYGNVQRCLYGGITFPAARLFREVSDRRGAPAL